jgi:hypothetical protein
VITGIQAIQIGGSAVFKKLRRRMVQIIVHGVFAQTLLMLGTVQHPSPCSILHCSTHDSTYLTALHNSTPANHRFAKYPIRHAK